MDQKIIDDEKTIDNDSYLMYDDLNDIKQCLNCEKVECNNCLKYKNGV